jgi:hypothetical protein
MPGPTAPQPASAPTAFHSGVFYPEREPLKRRMSKGKPGARDVAQW